MQVTIDGRKVKLTEAQVYVLRSIHEGCWLERSEEAAQLMWWRYGLPTVDRFIKNWTLYELINNKYIEEKQPKRFVLTPLGRRVAEAVSTKERAR